MRALVTGATGFVGRHLTAALEAKGSSVVACGGPRDVTPLPIDLADISALRAAFDIAQPDVVFHLAGQAFVPDAAANPQATHDTNVGGTANVVQALHEYERANDKRVRMVFTSSAEVYGIHPAEDYPLTETASRSPENTYAESKRDAEDLLRAASENGLDVVIARAFNHIGPGQDERFVVSSFAHQLARIAAGESPPLMHVGNLEAKRDFLDVRDVVDAYVALAEHGRAGDVYNVCSGEPHAISEVLRELIIAAHVPVEVREDPARMRPSDTPLSYGNNEKLRTATGWKQRIPLRRSIRDIYEGARKKVAP